MTLALGTALKHGSYVIDAQGIDDTIGPVYLATHVPKGEWVQLRILGSRHPEAIPPTEVRQGFYHHLETLPTWQHPLLSGVLSGFEEDGVCYQTLPTTLGVPLSRLVSPQVPFPVDRSLALMHQLYSGLNVLRSFGWGGLRLHLDQFWQGADGQTLTFVGFDLPPAEPADDATLEPAVVKALSRLLYTLLTGYPAAATQAPLAVDMRHRQPSLPPSLDALVEPGSHGAAPLSLAAWGALLPSLNQMSPASNTQAIQPTPPPPQPVPAPSPHAQSTGGGITHPASQGAPTTQILAPHQPPVGQRRSAWTPLALGLTGLVASLAGLSLGLYARLQPANVSSSPAADRFNPNQSFPSLPDWSENTLWQPWDQAPSLRRRPNYGDAPPSRFEETQPNSAPELGLPSTPQPQVPAPDPTAAPPMPDPEPAPRERRPDPVEAAPSPPPEGTSNGGTQRREAAPPVDPPPPLAPPSLPQAPAPSPSPSSGATPGAAPGISAPAPPTNHTRPAAPAPGDSQVNQVPASFPHRRESLMG
ncbi:hypothetical protein [Nodosilinea sp. P-1105]|uniref:hypothetical protein n=1 Tax=Nodosilinea sp. P-1105 TaxID=2546229 RepID=UPI00146B208C|nr:hypothetical protein [Nodosilinea sp. P-1105]NMF83174.1 hypothetical protein [Nodosilinea sp. P-1105]